MAITQLLSSINKSDTYPKSVSISAPDSCGMLILMPNSEISEQQLFELPTINVKIFDSSGKVFLNRDINLSTIDFNAIFTKQADPYSVPIYDIPSDCICSITPIFDTNAFRCHNETVLNGNIGSFTTSETGIVNTGMEDYKSLLWEIPTNTFDISVSFDNSNISSGGSSGGGGTGSVTSVAVSSSDGSATITGSPITSSGTINISVNVDDELSDTSTKPVQNKIVTSAINEKLNIDDAVGKNVEGTRYTISGQTVIAGKDAEIFNDYENNKAVGQYSHAEGTRTSAIGDYSHTEGYSTLATGDTSHAEGNGTQSTGGAGSHAEGNATNAFGSDSHAEGSATTASGHHSHAEGIGTHATGESSHAEGNHTQATGYNSHAEGNGTQAIGNDSHTEGVSTIAKSSCQHVQGKYNIEDANDKYAFIIGNGTYGNRSNAFAVDWDGNVYVNGAVDGVDVSKYAGKNVTGTEYTIDEQTVVASEGSEVFNNYENNKAIGSFSHAEGNYTTASGDFSHAEGAYTDASGEDSHAEGNSTTASGSDSHAEGYSTIASKRYSHAEGYNTEASGSSSHAEGEHTEASNDSSHAEGRTTVASGKYSHSEGESTKANGRNSHAEGLGAIAASDNQHAQGKYNIADTNNKYAFIIGNGTITNRSNAFAVDWDGNIYVNGDTTGVNVSTLSSILTPISESEYDAITTKDKPLYFIYD